VVPRGNTVSFGWPQIKAALLEYLAEENEISPLTLPPLNRDTNVTVPDLTEIGTDKARPLLGER